MMAKTFIDAQLNSEPLLLDMIHHCQWWSPLSADLNEPWIITKHCLSSRSNVDTAWLIMVSRGFPEVGLVINPMRYSFLKHTNCTHWNITKASSLSILGNYLITSNQSILLKKMVLIFRSYSNSPLGAIYWDILADHIQTSVITQVPPPTTSNCWIDYWSNIERSEAYGFVKSDWGYLE